MTTTTNLSTEKTIVILPIGSLSLTNGTQIRVAVNEATIQRYAALMETEEGRSKFPPIIVYRDLDGKFWIADGHHRIMAAIRCKLTEIRAGIRIGSKADALWAAAEINGKNSLQLTDNDICKAITMLLEAWPERSERAIADAVGCSPGYVNKVKHQVLPSKHLTQAGGSTDTRVIGKDGKSYPARQAKKAAQSNKTTVPTAHTTVAKFDKKETITPPENVAKEDTVDSDELQSRQKSASLSISPSSDHNNSVSERPLEKRFTNCSPNEFVCDIRAFYPQWFINSILGILVEQKQSEDRRRLKEDGTGRSDILIYSLFHKLDYPDRKVTFMALFEKLLANSPESIPGLIKDMESKYKNTLPAESDK